MSIIDELNPISAGLGVVEGGAEAITGAIDAKKDNAKLNALKHPFYKVQDEYFQNKNLAEQQASGGLSQASKNLFTSENERGIGAGISATLQGGGNVNDIAKLYDQYTRSITDLASRDSEAHMKNIEYFMSANKDLAGQKNIQFGVNELQPYEEKLKQLTESLKNDKQNIYGGLNTVVGSVSAAGTALSNEDLNKSMISKNNADANYYNTLFGDGSGKMPDVAQLPSLATVKTPVNIDTSKALNDSSVGNNYVSDAALIE